MLQYARFEYNRGAMPALTLKSNGSATRTIPLVPGVNRLGRDPANDHTIDDPTISARHCEIIVSDAMVLIRDLESMNGTFVDGQPVREAVLLHGQTLHLGGVEMLVEAVTVEIAIPVFSSPEKTSPFFADGRAACVNHQSSHAAVECTQCQKTFCDLCVHQIRRVGGASLTLCPSCSGHCRPITHGAPVTKRKSRLGSWVGKVTAKMTGRFARSSVP